MKRVKLIAAILLVGFLLSSCTSNKDKKNKPILKVAANLPLTGDLATYGISIRDGANYAMSEKTENQKNISFDFQDNEGKPKNAVAVFRKQALEDYNIYISGVKPQTMSIIDEVSKIGKPHIVWVFDAFICSEYKETYRTWLSYKYEHEQYLKYIEKKPPSKVAILYANLPHAAQEFNDIVIPKIKGLGIDDKSIYTEAYDWTRKDYKDIAVKVKDFSPDIIVINGFKNTIIGLIQALRGYDLIKENNTIVTYDMLDAAEDLSSEMTEGVRVVAPTFSFETNNKTIANWKKGFVQKYGRSPKYTDAYAYDMAKILIEISKFPIDSLSYRILKFKGTGITGPLVFDQDGDLVSNLQIGVYRNGELVIDKAE